MNKVSNTGDDDEMQDDYSELLEGYDFSKAVRGKYHQEYRNFQGKVPVKITSKEGDKYVTLCTLKAEATIAADGKLTAQIPADFAPGEYRITLIIEEPATPAIAEICEDENESE
jgi:hypothetical protein